jgi:predicted HTH transcriptional regulator
MIALVIPLKTHSITLRNNDRRRILDSTELRTYLPGAAEDVIAFLRKHMTREAIIGSVKRTDRWTFPVVAVREAIMNAIVHADYAQRGAPVRVALFDDRLEIENPGLLPFGLTIEDSQKGISKLRNRVLGRVFQELVLIEHWGSGIERMTAACRESGLDAPQFEEIGTHFRVTLRPSPAERQQ